MPELIDGFRVGNYFCSFPDGEFIKEDKDGNLFVLVDIYTVDKDNRVTRVPQSNVSEEAAEQINAEINRMLLDALDNVKNSEKD